LVIDVMRIIELCDEGWLYEKQGKLVLSCVIVYENSRLFWARKAEHTPHFIPQRPRVKPSRYLRAT
jgi:hypothetical protein